MVEVPAFAALSGPEDLGPFGARRADRGEGVPTGDEHRLGVAGLRSVRRSWTGRMHAPCSAARSLTTSRASGIASRSARLLRPCPVPVTTGLPRSSPGSQGAEQPQDRHSARSTGRPSPIRTSPAAQTGHGSSVDHAVSS